MFLGCVLLAVWVAGAVFDLLQLQLQPPMTIIVARRTKPRILVLVFI
jgi:hypothetical protein